MGGCERFLLRNEYDFLISTSKGDNGGKGLRIYLLELFNVMALFLTTLKHSYQKDRSDFTTYSEKIVTWKKFVHIKYFSTN